MLLTRFRADSTLFMNRTSLYPLFCCRFTKDRQWHVYLQGNKRNWRVRMECLPGRRNPFQSERHIPSHSGAVGISGYPISANGSGSRRGKRPVDLEGELEPRSVGRLRVHSRIFQSRNRRGNTKNIVFVGVWKFNANFSWALPAAIAHARGSIVRRQFPAASWVNASRWRSKWGIFRSSNEKFVFKDELRREESITLAVFSGDAVKCGSLISARRIVQNGSELLAAILTWHSETLPIFFTSVQPFSSSKNIWNRQINLPTIRQEIIGCYLFPFAGFVSGLDYSLRLSQRRVLHSSWTTTQHFVPVLSPSPKCSWTESAESRQSTSENQTYEVFDVHLRVTASFYSYSS